MRGGVSPAWHSTSEAADESPTAAGLTHLMPAGTFQPSSVRPATVAERIRYSATSNENLPTNCSGTTATGTHRLPRARTFATFDALILRGDILTVAVIEPDLYDTMFASAASMNSEDTVSVRLRSRKTRRELREQGHLSPSSPTALHLNAVS